MRQDSIQFSAANESPAKSPRFIVTILFDVGSLYITSHADITGVPGIVLAGHLKAPSAISQRIVPDEGRSEIGTFSFTLVDRGSDFTDEVRAKLDSGRGLRGKTVQLRIGYEGFDYTAFQLFQTQIVTGCEYQDGVYRIECADITREMRNEIFEPVATTLNASITDADTTIVVLDTSKFVAVAHGPAWSDAPNQTVYYFRIDAEIIRATGKTGTTFTGCARGVFNTRAVAHVFDTATPAERRPKVEEFIYLELPAPKLAYAVLTGQIHGTANTLPAHWHLGIATTFVRLADFTAIGADLWDTTNDANGFALRFEGLTKQNGKRFLEREVYVFLHAYSPVYSDGALGLRRLPALISDAAAVVTLTEREVQSVSALDHDYASLHNRLRVNWGYDIGRKEYTRATLFIDTNSTAIHGEAPVLEISSRGLHSGLHTDAIIAKRVDAWRDAYSYPPQRLTTTVMPSLNKYEVGDVMRVKIAGVRDFAGAGVSIDRSFLALRRTIDFASGDVSFELFGSTLRPAARPPTTGAVTPLPDAYYTSAGTALNTVVPMTGNSVDAGSHTIAGSADMNAAPSIFYHNADLTIPDGATITITGNVQLRVRGFLTLNGDINGAGGGKAGVVDPGGALTTPVLGTPGFIGTSRGWDGLNVTAVSIVRVILNTISTVPAGLTRGQFDAFPPLDLVVSGNSLLGIPSDLRGTSGGPGGRVLRTYSGGAATLGGAGAASGAGMVIVCRGMSFGASSSIVLDGANAATTTLQTDIPVYYHYPGPGGAGGPGALAIFLDGNQLSIPNIGGRFFARTGTVPAQGTPIFRAQMTVSASPGSGPGYIPIRTALSGYADAAVVSAQDLSNAAFRIQYVPQTLAPTPDVDTRPPAPTALVVTSTITMNTVRATLPAPGTFDEVEYWVSLDNNRANATRLARGLMSEATHELPSLATRYYWARTVLRNALGADVVSDWFPSSATGGIAGTTGNPGGWTPVVTNGGGAQMILRPGVEIEKSGGIDAWDSAVHSLQSYAEGASVTWRVAQTNAELMIALNSDPTTDASYTSLDYAFFIRADSNLHIYENGALISTHGTYSTSTVFGIHDVGGVIVYEVNGSVVRSVVRANRVPLFMDSSFGTSGSRALDVVFSQRNPTPIRITEDPQIIDLSHWLLSGNTEFLATGGQVGGAVRMWGVGSIIAKSRGPRDLRVAGGEILRWRVLMLAAGSKLSTLGADIRVIVIHEEAGGGNPQSEQQSISSQQLDFPTGVWTMIFGHVVVRPALVGSGARYARLRLDVSNNFGSQGTDYALIDLFDAEPVREQSISRRYTGGSRDLDWQDLHALIEVENPSPVTLTISASSLAQFPIDSEIYIQQYGSGSVTVAPAVGVQLLTPGGVSGARAINGVYATVGIKKVEPGTWVGVGNWAP